MTHKTSEVLAFARGARERYETAVNDDARGIGRSPRQWRLIAVDLRLAGDALFGLLREGAAGKPDGEAPLLTSGVVQATWARATDAQQRADHAARVDALVARAGS
jgi:hypothetical protein